MARKKKEVEKQQTEIEIVQREMERISVWIVGTTPFICNRVSEKAKRELLDPSPRKNRVAKEQSLKHHPLEEFRSSPYILRDDSAPTYLAVLAVSFKKSMMSAALDLPGTTKAQIGRLIRAVGERLPLYGIPELFMTIVRSADQKRTPDVRTRAIVPKWAVPLDLMYPVPLLRSKSVLNLLAAAGEGSGVGDWRQEKGSADYGSFRLAQPDDEELLAILSSGGRDAQIAAMASPAYYDQETEELFEWWLERVRDRDLKVV